MRLILLILLLCSFSADAQMIIKAHANYRPYAQPAANLLLDDYPGAAVAYSVRKLDKDYAGNCIRVRRASNNQEQDFGFVNNFLDTSAIKTFCSGTDGFITIWYDQSGNSRNAIQSTAANQPRIYRNTGAIIENLYNIAAPRWDNSRLEAVFNFTPSAQSVFVASLFDQGGSTNTFARLVSQSTTANDYNANVYIPLLRNDNTANFGSYYNAMRATVAISYNNLLLYTNIHTGSQIQNRINGQTASTFNSSITGNYTRISIGNATSTTTAVDGRFFGHIHEVVIYNSDQSSNRVAIENNINDFYNIYFNGNFTGILDSYPNSAAAYSLRNLSSTYKGPLIRVRRSNDNAEQDIFGDYYGNLDTIGLKSFVGANNAFVTTWYDQSGNARNATQGTAANQPRIANLGVIDRRSGDISLVFDGSNDFMSANNTSGGNISPTSYYCISSRGNSVDQIRTIVSTGILSSTTSGWGLYYTINSAPSNTINNLVAQVRFQPQTNISSIGNIANTINTNTLNFNIITTTSNSIWLNGGNNVTENYSYTNNTFTRDVHIGQNGSNALYLNGTVTEFVIWNTNQSSNRTGIESNINTYYSIY